MTEVHFPGRSSSGSEFASSCDDDDDGGVTGCKTQAQSIPFLFQSTAPLPGWAQ